MAKKVPTHEWVGTPLNIGVINPYALSEVILGRKVNWKRISDTRKLLEKTLETPYEDLFDPAKSPILYTGVDLPEVQVSKAVTPKVAAAAAAVASTHAAPVVSGLPHAGMTDLDVMAAGDWSPAGAVWKDPGDFFEEGTEFFDPVQGGLGDCYFIAALASVAWARTYAVAQRTRATGHTPQEFVDMIEFYKAAGTLPEKLEVTEVLPLTGAGGYFYARSMETGEIWPAIYEKAYAKWKTGATGDRPEYPRIAGGDPVRACSEITGLTRYYYATAGMSANDILMQVKSNSVSCKTFNPMVAWTYSSASVAPGNINYDNAHLVANHAYSILGWHFANNVNYIVLRNPWGSYEATTDIVGGSWVAYDAPYHFGPGFWRNITLGTNDGVFALTVDAFKRYFAGFGLVK
jgi:hypothetical protein